MARPFRFNRSFDLDVDAATIWRALQRTDDYPRWWPWLETFQSDGLRPGATDAVIRSPFGYRLRVQVTVLEARADRLLVTEVHGDLEGPARLDLSQNGAGTTAQLRWELDLRAPLLRRLLPAGRPVMVWGHDQIVGRALREFRRALSA